MNIEVIIRDVDSNVGSSLMKFVGTESLDIRERGGEKTIILGFKGKERHGMGVSDYLRDLVRQSTPDDTFNN